MSRRKVEQPRLPMRLPETEWDKEQRRRGAVSEVAMVRQRRLAREARAHAKQKAYEQANRRVDPEVLAAIGRGILRRMP